MADNDIKIRLLVQTASGKKEIREFNSSLDGMGKSAQTASKKTQGSFKSLFSSAKKFIGVAGVAGLVYGAARTIQAGFNRMMDKGKEFESSLAELSAITGISGKDLEVLGKNALDTSITYGVAASEIIQANKLVASQLAEKIDFGTTEGMRELQEVSEQAVVLAQASGETLSTAVQTTTTVLNQFNLEASETNRIINSIAAGAKFGAAEAQQQSDSYREAGSVFAAANREFEELNASTQILALNAIHGSRAGTGLRNMMVILQSEADKLAKYGINDVNVKTESFSETLRKLKPLLTDTNALSEIFGRENITVAQILIQNAELIEQMNEKVRGTNTAYEQASTRINTYKGAVNKLYSALDAQLIPAFQETSGVIVDMINFTTQLIIKTGQFVNWLNSLTDAGSGLREEFRQINEEFRKNGGITEDQREAIQKTVNALEKEVDAQKKIVDQGIKYGERAFIEADNRLEILQARLGGYISLLSLTSKEANKSEQSITELTEAFIEQTNATPLADQNQELNPFAQIGMGDAGVKEAAISAQQEIANQESQLHEERMGRFKQQRDTMDDTADHGVESMSALTQIIGSGLNSALDRTIEALIFAEDKMLNMENIGKSLLSGVLSGLAKYGLLAATGGTGTIFAKILGFKNGGPIGYSTGGPIYGPGTSRSDSVPIMASRGEYMMNARSTKAIGVHRMNMMNRSPGFAQSVAGMIDRLPSLKADSVNLDSVENALGSSGGESFSDKAIISKLDDVASRIENMEVNAFIDYNSFKKDLAKLDNIQKEMGKG